MLLYNFVSEYAKNLPANGETFDYKKAFIRLGATTLATCTLASCEVVPPDLGSPEPLPTQKPIAWCKPGYVVFDPDSVLVLGPDHTSITVKRKDGTIDRYEVNVTTVAINEQPLVESGAGRRPRVTEPERCKFVDRYYSPSAGQSIGSETWLQEVERTTDTICPHGIQLLGTDLRLNKGGAPEEADASIVSCRRRP